MFQTLAVTNFGVGLIFQPLPAVRNLNPLMIIETLTGKLNFMSTALSVDRLLALLLGLRYKHVTLKRVKGIA